MKKINPHRIMKFTIGVTAALVTPFSLASDVIYIGEDYYGDNIDAAILEAKQNKREGNYKNKYWYNRTTSRSFSLPKLNSYELEQTQLKGALQPTAAGADSHPTKNKDDFLFNPQLSERKENPINRVNLKKENEPSFSAGPVIVQDITHEFSRGTKVTTQSIISDSTIVSTPKP